MKTKSLEHKGTAPQKLDFFYLTFGVQFNFEQECFVMVKKAYSVETKLACIEMKKTGKSNKVIMDTLGIKNVSQVKTWW